MRESVSLIVLLILVAGGLFAQSHRISGQILDSLDNPMNGASVMLLHERDSILEAFSIVDQKGTFNIFTENTGNYLIQATFLGYEDYTKFLSITEQDQQIDLGTIRLASKNKNLDEILVSEEIIPIVINNDTVEYNARAFGVQPNDKVEDLLKKLPGIEVDREGNLKSGGEDINRVLVDGKEFFGNDPKLATKNLPADIVDKVQLFDKASDFAEFSGIDDGEEEKTINLKLKEDKKNGYFGELYADYGTDNRFRSGLSLNRFSKTSQFSVLGNSNNVNEQAFDFQDYLNFMGGIQALASGGRVEINGNELGIPMSSSGEGIITSTSGGINYNRDFGKNTELSSSYFYGRSRTDKESAIDRTNFLDDGTFQSISNSVRRGGNDNHRMNLNLRHRLDSVSRINFRSNFGYGNYFSNFMGNSLNFAPDGRLQNMGNSFNLTDGNSLNFSSSLNYQRRLKKTGRTISVSSNLGYLKRTTTSQLVSRNEFFENGPSLFVDSLNQNHSDFNDQLEYGSRISYTEPLWKGQFLELHGTYLRQENEVDKDVFDIIGPDEELFNPILSNAYNRVYQFLRGGFRYRLNKKKISFSTGLQAQRSLLDGELLSLNTRISQEFFNFLPEMKLNLQFDRNSNFDLRYDTGVREPSLQELQPVIDNSDPLNLYVGNPDLNAEYSHRIGLRFFTFSAFSFTSFFANLNASFTRNKITNAKTIDELLVQTTTPVNVDYERALEASSQLSTPIRFIGAKVNVSANQSYNNSLLFINTKENKVDRWVSRGSLSFENRKKNVFDFLIGMDLAFNKTSYSENENLNQAFLSQDYYSDLDVNIASRVKLSSSFTYTIYGGDAFAESETVALWSATANLFFLKGKKAQLRFSVFDLLNQNQGIQRSSEFNYVQDERTNNLGRYFMVGLTYNLSGFGKPDPNEMHIEINSGPSRRR